MGDADNNNHIRMSDRDIEEWMDDVVGELDDGLTRMLSFINVLNVRTENILSEIESWQMFRLCFTALNLFVVPVVVSILAAYISTGIVEYNSPTQAGLQTIISLLMLFSAFIGFPIYLFTLRNAYSKEDTVEPKRTHSGQWEDVDGRSSEVVRDESALLLAVADASIERLSEAGRMLNQRLQDTIRIGNSRRDNQPAQVESANVQTSMDTRDRRTSESYSNEEVTSREEKLVDLDTAYSSDAAISDALRTELINKIDVSLLALEASHQPFSEAESKLSEWMSSPQPKTTGLRDIAVGRVTDDGSEPKDSFIVDGFIPFDSVRRQELYSQ